MITCKALPQVPQGRSAPSRSCRLQMRRQMPGVFQLTDLEPGLTYNLEFGPLAQAQLNILERKGCVVRTMPEAKDIRRLRFIALSCNWPSRLEPDAKDPWDTIEGICRDGGCDIMLHLGDQVYTWENGCTLAAQRLMEAAEEPDTTPELRLKMTLNAATKLQESYQSTWGRPNTAAALSHASNLMIWSDNDVTNDFTVLRKPDGSQLYSPSYLTVAMRVYNMYQASLWNPEIVTDQAALQELQVMEAWHFHQYGPCGVFMIDMRGNRIQPNGVLRPGLPKILSERQREALKAAFESDGLQCMLVCAEIPFIDEGPNGIQEKAEKLPFLKDHWTHDVEELTWLLDLCFTWKASKPMREVLLLGGDIHVSVDTIISDDKTGLTLRQVTTSPITNRATPFFPQLEGRLNERYSWKHEAFPEQRSFCKLDLTFENGEVKTNIELVRFAQPRRANSLG